MEFEDVIARAEFLASGNAFTIQRIGDYANWDFDLLKAAADHYEYYGRRVPGIEKAFIQAAAQAQDRQHRRASRPAPGLGRTATARPARRTSDRVDVKLALVLEDRNGDLLLLADKRQPQLVKEWTLRWIPTAGDNLTLFAVGGKPVRMRVLMSIDDGVLPLVGGAVSDAWWAELQARGFCFMVASD